MKYEKTTKEIPADNSEHDFSEFMWMAEEGVENFDRRVVNELWEEMFIEACFEEMLAEEEQWFYPEQSSELADTLQGLTLSEETLEDRIKNSRLNPDAPEFIPSWFIKNTSGTK